MRVDLHFYVSLTSLICIIIIISHGAQLSAKVENSTIQVDNKISQFDSLMVLLKSQFQKIDAGKCLAMYRNLLQDYTI